MLHQTSNDVQVTAAVPCFNGERFIARTLEGLLAQTRTADEILVIDDGSTDGTVQEVQRFEPTVRLVRHGKNEGLAAARNTALAHASGDVLVFVDADACPDPGVIAALLAEFTDPQIGAVGGQGIEVNIHTIYDVWRKKYLSQTAGEKRIGRRGWIGGLCAAFRKSALEEIGGFDPFYRTNAEDHDISYRLHKAGYLLVYTPYAKVYHQRTDDWTSLCRMVYRYWYWRHIVMKRNGIQPPHLLYVYHAVRDCIRGVQRDLLEEKQPGLAAIDIAVLPIKLVAMVRAAWECKSLQADTDAR